MKNPNPPRVTSLSQSCIYEGLESSSTQWHGTVISIGETVHPLYNDKGIIIERKDWEFLHFHPEMNGGLQFKSKDSSSPFSRVLPIFWA
jgi:hypothetical protein